MLIAQIKKENYRILFWALLCSLTVWIVLFSIYHNLVINDFDQILSFKS